MKALDFAAALVAARHDQDAVLAAIGEGLDGAEDRDELLIETVLLLIGLVHGSGHLAPQVTMMLDVFASLPQAVNTGPKREVYVLKASDVDQVKVDALFKDITQGTSREDRVWGVGVIPGGVHAVSLEGSGFAPRYVALIGADHAQADVVRGQFAAKDGR